MKSLVATLLIFVFFLTSLKAEINFETATFELIENGNWITISVKLESSSPKESHKTKPFLIGFDGNLKKEEFHAIRLDKNTFSIPERLSYKNQIGRFFLNKSSVRNGSFQKLYNYIPDIEKTNLGQSCSLLRNYQNVNKIMDAVSKIRPEHKHFFQSWKTKGGLIKLAALCDEQVNKIYVVDIQKTLVSLGKEVGQVDGKWGRKTENAIKLVYSEFGFKWHSEPNINQIRKIRKSLGEKAPPLSKVNTNDEHFDIYGNLKKPPPAVTVATKLNKRKTINVFRAWNPDLGLTKYGLAWTSSPKYSSSTITLNEVYWNYHYVGKSSSQYKGIEKFLTKKNWDHDMEYGKTVSVKIVDPEYAEFIAKIIKQNVRSSKSDGVILDWWHDYHQSSSGYSKMSVNAARQKIAKSIRKQLGPNKIILGNVNWRKDLSTVKNLNGVFLELYKEPYESSSGRLYTFSELLKIESLLEYYQRNLAHPKLIALEGWRKTKNLSNKDRNTRENRRMAKVLTAMSVVIPENGYILYADNNPDTSDGDHMHLFYDFYSFDVGKPVKGGKKLAFGIGLKEHKRGFVAYNITQRDFVTTRKNGSSVTIPPYSGLFCKEVGKRKCLSLD